MQSVMHASLRSYTDRRSSTDSLEHARSWIGRRVVLRAPLLGFEPGLACIVMCVVDFGEGFLLWISTDDNQTREVGQLEIQRVLQYFQLSPSTSTH